MYVSNASTFKLNFVLNKNIFHYLQITINSNCFYYCSLFVSYNKTLRSNHGHDGRGMIFSPLAYFCRIKQVYDKAMKAYLSLSENCQ